MLTPAIVCFLCGLLLGWRFEVGAAAGASLIALLSTLFYATSQGFPLWAVLLCIAFNVTALQMGYLASCACIRRERKAATAPLRRSNFAAGGKGALFAQRQIENGAP